MCYLRIFNYFVNNTLNCIGLFCTNSYKVELLIFTLINVEVYKTYN